MWKERKLLWQKMPENVQNKQRCSVKLLMDTQTLRPEGQLYQLLDFIHNISDQISYLHWSELKSLCLLKHCFQKDIYFWFIKTSECKNLQFFLVVCSNILLSSLVKKNSEFFYSNLSIFKSYQFILIILVLFSHIEEPLVPVILPHVGTYTP